MLCPWFELQLHFFCDIIQASKTCEIKYSNFIMCTSRGMFSVIQVEGLFSSPELPSGFTSCHRDFFSSLQAEEKSLCKPESNLHMTLEHVFVRVLQVCGLRGS